MSEQQSERDQLLQIWSDWAEWATGPSDAQPLVYGGSPYPGWDGVQCISLAELRNRWRLDEERR